MSIFTEKELDYMREQKLWRSDTVHLDGNPHVVPVGLRYNPETDTVDIGGRNIAELLESGGEEFGRGFDPEIIRLHPVRIIAWGIDEKRQSRTVNSQSVEANINQIHVIV